MTKFYTGERDVPLICWHITAANSSSFCVLVLFFIYLGIFYLAGNIYSVWACFNMTCCSYYFSFISLIPKEIFFTSQIFDFFSLSLFSFFPLFQQLLKVLDEVGQLLFFLECLELKFLIILALVQYTWIKKLISNWHLEEKVFIFVYPSG